MNDSSTSTSSSSSGPPDYLKPYLTEALQGSQQRFQGGGPQYYPGQTVTPFAPQTQQALDLTQARATNGSPVTSAAQNLTTDTLNGKYLNSNPQLDAAFNHAADATRGQLDTQFAGAGRDMSAEQPARADQLNNLATQFYYNNYNDERNRQQGAVSNALPLANQDYTDLGALQTVGQNYQDLTTRQNQDAASRWDFGQNAPDVNLNNYLSRVLGQPGNTTTTTSPLYHNNVAGGLGGALLGSQIGGNLGNNSGWGTLLGGLAGYFGS